MLVGWGRMIRELLDCFLDPVALTFCHHPQLVHTAVVVLARYDSEGSSSYEQRIDQGHLRQGLCVGNWWCYNAFASKAYAVHKVCLMFTSISCRARDAEVARLRAELQQARLIAQPPRRPSAPSGPPAAERAGAVAGARRRYSEPAPAARALALPDLATLAYHRQPALRVRFVPGQLEDVAARAQAQGLRRGAGKR